MIDFLNEKTINSAKVTEFFLMKIDLLEDFVKIRLNF